MRWTAYRVVFRLLTPMHMGAAKLGNLQITRPYIHGKALWGGLTARLTRDDPGPDGDYERVGRRANEELAFGYFYPTTGNQVTLWPWDNPDEFGWRYLGSYASTALNYSQFSAEEGSLHETEYVAPFTRDGEPVNLIGYIFAQEGCSLPWRPTLERLQLGGERTYGWGRLALSHISTATGGLFDRYAMELHSSRPSVTLGGQDHLLAHTLAVGAGAVKARGRLAPVVGRETRVADAHGRNLSRALICWEPGSSVEAAVTFAIGPYGVWAAAQ
jgi:hypothetical protein